MIDCRAIREELEIATVEPGGLDRLMAGDTPEAALVAGHLAACPLCSEELARLHRADQLLRPILASMASSDLRERVLQQVHDLGRARPVSSAMLAIVPPPDAPSAAGAAVGPAFGAGSPLASIPDRRDAVAAAGGADLRSAVTGVADPAPMALGRQSARGRSGFAFPAAAAAVLALALLGGALIGRGTAPAPPPSDAAEALAMVSRETTAVMEAPDARMVVLRTADGTPRGSLVAAHSTGRMVVLATDLPAAPAGHEYRCWVEAAGARAPLGEMWLTEGVYWWSGPAAIPDGAAGSMTFGVSLASTSGQPGGSPPVPVLTGN